jgi:hypothetical protein
MTELTESASYFFAAIENLTDRELADDVYRNLIEMLPYQLHDDLSAAAEVALA